MATWQVTGPDGQSRDLPSRAAARAWLKAHPGWRSNEYGRRIELGTAKGKSRREARGHPAWEPRPIKPGKSKRMKHRREGILVGAPGGKEELPPGALARALRVWRRRHPKEPAVSLFIFGVPDTLGLPSQWTSPRLRRYLERRRAEEAAKPSPEPLWLGGSVDVDAFEALLRQLGPDRELAALEGIGAPAWRKVYQVNLGVPA